MNDEQLYVIMYTVYKRMNDIMKYWMTMVMLLESDEEGIVSTGALSQQMTLIKSSMIHTKRDATRLKGKVNNFVYCLENVIDKSARRALENL